MSRRKCISYAWLCEVQYANPSIVFLRIIEVLDNIFNISIDSTFLGSMSRFCLCSNAAFPASLSFHSLLASWLARLWVASEHSLVAWFRHPQWLQVGLLELTSTEVVFPLSRFSSLVLSWVSPRLLLPPPCCCEPEVVVMFYCCHPAPSAVCPNWAAIAHASETVLGIRMSFLLNSATFWGTEARFIKSCKAARAFVDFPMLLIRSFTSAFWWSTSSFASWNRMISVAELLS